MPRAFQGAPQLQCLIMRDKKLLQLQPGGLTQLTALTSLTLTNCGLQNVPVNIASLSTTLRELDVSHNARLQVDSAALARLMRCSRLNTLSLYKPDIGAWQCQLSDAVWQGIEQHINEEGYTPAQYSVQSLSHIVRLPSDFYKRYGRDLTVCVTYQAHAKYLRARSRE